MFVVIACALVAMLGVGATALVAGADDPGASCSGQVPVRIVVTPELQEVVENAAGALEKRGVDVGEGCADYQVRAQPAAELLGEEQAGTEELPDLWIPDAGIWLGQLPEDAIPDDSRVRRFAKTAVVLVGHEGAAQPATWLSAMSAPTSGMVDPRQSAASVGALAALHGESLAGTVAGTDVAAWLVATAQRPGGDELTQAALLDDAVTGTTNAPGFFPATEQWYLEQVAADPAPAISAVVPKSGSVLLDYPLATLGGASADRAAAALSDYLGTSAGAESLADAGFRPPSGIAPEDSAGVSTITELAVVDSSGVERLLDQWVTLSVRTRMLAVIDVSGSMAKLAGDKSRIQLAAGAASHALQLLPDDAEVGVWAFSIGLGEGTRDYREVVPTRELGAAVGGRTHRATTLAAMRGMPGLVGRGTGLYDSVLAAYRTAKATFDPARFNSVVVLTDGRNHDPDGLSLDQLLAALERESDPATPIQVVTIGMGPDADASRLERISAATGAKSYVALDPRDIGEIFTSALLERVRWGLQ
jgi:hypothetical protein